MKFALCFSGHPRTFERCFHSINEQLLTKYNCDTFISTYNTHEYINNNIINLYHPKRINFNDENDILNRNNHYFNQLDNIKTIIMHNVNDISNNSIGFNPNSNDLNNFFNYDNMNKDFSYERINVRALCQFFGMYDVSQLCLDYINNNGVHYDYILRLRLDDHIVNNFEVHHLDENEILVNFIQNYCNSVKLHDHFFMARPNTYFRLANLYNDLPNIIRFVNENRCWLPGFGYQETILLIQVILHNIRIKETNNYKIIKLD